MRAKAGNNPHNSGQFISSTEGLDYELIDCGNQRKLERFERFILNRPEISAKWSPSLPKENWEKAHWYFFEQKGKKGEWRAVQGGEQKWQVAYKSQHLSLNFLCELTAFKHIGLFPEQAANWQYLEQFIKSSKKKVKVLNLFAYTGAASIVSAAAGAEVTNIDSVKQVLNWGRENGKTNQIDGIRWILEDARKFVEKSVRRGDTYHAIIMDPPAFGYGAKKEKWKLEQHLPGLLEQVIKLLDPDHACFILNTYSPKLKQSDLKQLLQTTKGFPKAFELSKLGLKSEANQQLILGDLVRFSKF